MKRLNLFKPAFLKIPVIICIAAGLTCTCYSQQIIINGKGEKVVIYPDGSWRYYEDADSVLVKKKPQLDDVVTDSERRSQNIGKEPDLLDDEESARQSLAFIAKLRAEELRVRQELRKATTQKFDTEGRLEEALNNKELIEPDLIADIEDMLEATKDHMKFARKKLKKLSKIQDKAARLPDYAPEKRYEKLQKLLVKYKAYEAYKSNYDDEKTRERPESREKKDDRIKTEPREVAVSKDTSGKESRKAPRVFDHEPLANSMREQISRWSGEVPKNYRRAPRECEYSLRIDGRNGESRKVELKKSVIFTHTDDDLRPYFGDEELVTCLAFLTELGENTYLTLEFRIASPNAQKNFGPLVEGSLLRIKLLNGIFVNLYNMRYDAGKIDPYSGHTIYTGRYPVGNSERRSLSKASVEFIRVIWGTGFEDYPVYDLDFFKHQIDCIESTK